MSTRSLLIKCHSLTKEASPCMDRAINASLDWLHDAFGCSLMHWHRCPWGDRGKGGEGFSIRTLHPGYPARVDEVLACIPAAVSHWPVLLSKATCSFSLWWTSGLPICCRYCNRRKGRIECSSKYKLHLKTSVNFKKGLLTSWIWIILLRMLVNFHGCQIYLLSAKVSSWLSKVSQSGYQVVLEYITNLTRCFFLPEKKQCEISLKCAG